MGRRNLGVLAVTRAPNLNPAPADNSERGGLRLRLGARGALHSRLGSARVSRHAARVRVLIVGCGYVGLPLGAELVRRGRTTPARLAAATRLELAMMLMDGFVSYPRAPLSVSPIPINYCALPKLFPRSRWLQKAADFVCPLKSTEN